MTSIQACLRQQVTRQRRPWHEIATWLARALQGLVLRWRRARRDRVAVKALSKLDDDQLKDIGLTRFEIEAFVAGSSLQGRETTP
jgi:uncharacterized protein YjiS (DUF1127 family)